MAVRRRLAAPLALTALTALASPRMLAQQPAPSGASASDLARATQNPIGDLKTVPLQFNFTSGGPLEDRSLLNVNFQPVIPVRVASWNLVMRTIVPWFDAPATDDDERVKGLGDIQEQLFLTPARPGRLVWGLGPVLQFPTATNELLRTGDWAAGPGLVLVTHAGRFVLAGLVTQAWTFAGDDEGPNVSLLTVQPAINYNLPDGWAVSFSPIVTANWSAPSGEEWTVPLGLGVSKVTSLGRQPMNIGLHYYHNVEAPPGTGSNLLRFAVAFLFPNPPAR